MTQEGSLPPLIAPAYVSQTITGLVSGATYHFRIIGSNISGAAYGQSISFQTAPPFDVSTAGLPAFSFGSIDLGDYDNDGFADALLTGDLRQFHEDPLQTMARVYRNVGNNSFSNINAALAPVYLSSAAWGDYNNDGWLDIALTGYQSINYFSSSVARIYRNNGPDGTFTELTVALPQRTMYNKQPLLWWDFNNDGRSDLLIGDRLFRNDDYDVFTDSGISLGNLSHEPYWWDLDNDGWKDLLSGRAIFRNNGQESLVWLTLPWPYGPLLQGLGDPSSTAADFDNSGTQDFALAAAVGSEFRSEFYRNEGTSAVNRVTTFTYLNGNLSADTTKSLHTADFDNDGRLDIFVASSNAFYNEGNFKFLSIATGLPRLSSTAADFADIDRDGRLDVVCAGSLNGDKSSAFLVRNLTEMPNQRPVAPVGLTATVLSNTVLLMWQRSADIETPASALSYNLRVGTSSRGYDIVTPDSDTEGLRRLAKPGNAGFTNAFNLRDLPWTARYYWSVQAIDGGFEGSEFSAEGSFEATVPPRAKTFSGSQVSSTAATINSMITANGFPSVTWFEWGANSDFGNITETRKVESAEINVLVSSRLTGLLPNTIYRFRAVASNSVGITFGREFTIRTSNIVEHVSAPLQPVNNGTGEWADFNNDGWLDVVISGSLGLGGVFTGLYENDGAGSFKQLNTALPALSRSKALWHDFNNDGCIDLLLTGTTNNRSSGQITRIYRNDRNGLFTDVEAHLPLDMIRKPILWLDFNNDGRDDLLLASTIFINNGSSTFTEFDGALQPTPALTDGKAERGDYDRDGFIDILLSGTTDDSYAGAFVKLYRNMGGLFFTDINVRFPSILGAASWTDFNNDGWLDVLITGSFTNDSSGTQTYLFENDRNGNFSERARQIAPVWTSASRWTDFDNDGWPDVVLAGNTQSNVIQSRFFKNNADATFSVVDLGLPPVWSGMTSWGDYDNDGRIDMLLFAEAANLFTASTTLFRNVNSVTNAPPSPPTALNAITRSNRVTFNWNAATDDHTPSGALSYNLRVATSPAGCDIVSPLSAAGGFRRVPIPGNTGTCREWELRDLQPGTYYWSVQSVDGAFAGSQFAAEKMFVIGQPWIVSFEVETLRGSRLRFHGDPDTRYRVLVSADLTNWTQADFATEVAPGYYEFIATTGAGQRFFKVAEDSQSGDPLSVD